MHARHRTMLLAIAATAVGLLLLYLAAGSATRSGARGSTEAASGSGARHAERSPQGATPASPWPPGDPRAGALAPRGRPPAPGDPRTRPSPALQPAPADLRDAEERAAALSDHADYPAAAIEAEGCLQLDPSNAACLDVKRWSLARVGDFEQAYPLLSDCLAQRPDDVRCLSAMVPTRLWRNELGEARVAAERLAKLDPGGAWTELALGQTAAADGRADEALDHFQRACDGGLAEACGQAGRQTGELPP